MSFPAGSEVDPESYLQVTKASSRLINSFQNEFKIMVLEAEDMEMEVFSALTNSNIKFISGLRSFVDRVAKFGILKEEEIMQVFSHYLGCKL